MKVSIGVFAHNEETNIGRLLEKLTEQIAQTVDLSNIIVVSSGSTDRTNDIVRDFARKNKKIRLLKQKQRRGKASAVNIFLKAATADICVFVNADSLPEKDAVEKLCKQFSDSKTGMTGARVIPLTKKDSILGFTVNLLWELHHEISLKYPKVGELIAVRKIFERIDEKTAVDEAFIEPIILKNNLQLKYVPEAVVYTKSPATFKDFIKQRRRIYTGHNYLKKTHNYTVSTYNNLRVLKFWLRHLSLNPKHNLKLITALMLEAYARLLGNYDFYIRKKDYSIWEK